MIKTVILGSGNVARHFISAFSQSPEIDLLQVFARQKSAVEDLVPAQKIVSDYSLIAEADIYIIAVSDSAVAEVSKKIPFQNKLAVHSSGSVPFEDLDSKNRRGVFYPLQTFTKNKEINFAKIPFCLESESDDDYLILENLAEALQAKHYLIDGEQRKSLHLAAVFVNNFTNHLYQIGKEICQENFVPFEILKPLIAETADKIKTLSPIDAQTGPAKRNDQNTIERHLKMLQDENQKKIYTLLTQSIQNTDVKKL